MKATHRETALSLIEQEQNDDGNPPGHPSGGCASVTVEIGGVSDSGQVEHDTLYVRNAPAAILDALRDHGFTLSADGDGGVRVEDYRLDDEDA